MYRAFVRAKSGCDKWHDYEMSVAVHEFQLAEGRQDQIFLHLFNFTERSNCFADHIIAHDGDAVVGAAYAVVKILFTAEVGAPLGKKLCVSQLHLLPDRKLKFVD